MICYCHSHYVYNLKEAPLVYCDVLKRKYPSILWINIYNNNVDGDGLQSTAKNCFFLHQLNLSSLMLNVVLIVCIQKMI